MKKQWWRAITRQSTGIMQLANMVWQISLATLFPTKSFSMLHIWGQLWLILCCGRWNQVSLEVDLWDRPEGLYFQQRPTLWFGNLGMTEGWLSSCHASICGFDWSAKRTELIPVRSDRWLQEPSISSWYGQIDFPSNSLYLSPSFPQLLRTCGSFSIQEVEVMKSYRQTIYFPSIE